MFTCNPKLLEFLQFTHDGSTVPQFIAARSFVEEKVKAVQIKPKHLRSVMQYRRHVLQTPTPQVRGLLTAMAEKAQQAAFDSLAPQRDGSLIRAVRLAVAAEKAYDAPKKVDARTIISIGHQLMSNARLTISSPSSSESSKKLFKFTHDKLDPAKALYRCLPSPKLGMVWMPVPRIILSGAAGAVIRSRMFHPRKVHGIAEPVEHIALDEVAGMLRHRLARAGNVRALVKDGLSDLLIQAASELETRAKPQAVRSVDYLENCNLFWARAAASHTICSCALPFSSQQHAHVQAVGLLLLPSKEYPSQDPCRAQSRCASFSHMFKRKCMSVPSCGTKKEKGALRC